MAPSVKTFADSAAVAEWAAATVANELTEAVARQGSAVWVAAGGSTPLAAYRLLASQHGRAIPWDRVSVAMGDERCVEIDHPDSNWGQLASALLDVPGPDAARRLRPHVELNAEAAAESYESDLSQLPLLPSGRPRLDHVWLGMGEDGHTLSLFPGHPAAAIENRLVVPVHDSPKPPPDRISLTFDALAGAIHCVILAAGAGKRDALARALDGDRDLPVARAAATVTDAGGRVTWTVDVAASGGS